MTIHKAQGKTMKYLAIDLSHVFECGMTYVALSRGVSSNQMSVKGFKKEDVKTNPRVLEFDKTIRGEDAYQPTPVVQVIPPHN